MLQPLQAVMGTIKYKMCRRPGYKVKRWVYCLHAARTLFFHPFHTHHSRTAQVHRSTGVHRGGRRLRLGSTPISPAWMAGSSGAVGEEQRGRGGYAAAGLICSEGERGRRRQGEGQGRARMGWVGAGSGGAATPGGWGKRRVPEGCRRRAHVDREGRENSEG